MSQQLSLKEAETKAWRSVFQDGLWDIYLGILLLAMGIGDLLDGLSLSKVGYYAIYFGMIAIGMLTLWAGKRFITLPRLGRVKFGPKGKSRQTKTRLLLFASVSLGLLLWFLADAVSEGGFGDRVMWDVVFPLGYILNMLLVFGLGAYFLDYPRLYVIAVLYALPVPLQILLRQVTGNSAAFYTFAIPAFFILVMGLVCLVRFMRSYPVVSNSEMEAGHGLGN
jgi:hypothetical protein